MTMKYILDTSAVLSGKDIPLTEDLFIPSGVLDEIKREDRWSRKLENMRSGGLQVIEPPAAQIERVKKRAKKTGDDIRLSDVDVQVVALALHLEGTIITDDRSIQNIASNLDVEYQGLAQEEITEEYEWSYRCEKCGRWYEEPKEKCQRCGGDIKSARLV